MLEQSHVVAKDVLWLRINYGKNYHSQYWGAKLLHQADQEEEARCSKQLFSILFYNCTRISEAQGTQVK